MMPDGGIPLVLFIDGGESSIAAQALQSGGALPCALAVAKGFEDANSKVSDGILPDVIFLRISADEQDGFAGTPDRPAALAPRGGACPYCRICGNRRSRLYRRNIRASDDVLHPAACVRRKVRLSAAQCFRVLVSHGSAADSPATTGRTTERAGISPGPKL